MPYAVKKLLFAGVAGISGLMDVLLSVCLKSKGSINVT